MSHQKKDEYNNDIYKGFFFTRVRQTVYKWWCVVYRPVYKLTHQGYWPPEKEPGYVPTTQGDTSVTPVQTTNQEAPSVIPEQTTNRGASSAMPATQTANQNTSPVTPATQTATRETSSAMATQMANQILQERQNNINQTVASHADSSSVENVWDDSVDTSGMSEESVDLAKEIMARLAREAAEDEAKKQAQIDKAKQEAEEKARLEEIMRSNKVDISQYIEAGKASRPHEVDIADNPD